MEYGELLLADLALQRGVANARDVAAALQRLWEGGEPFAGQLGSSDATRKSLDEALEARRRRG